MRSDWGLIQKNPVRNVIAKPTKPRTIQSMSKVHTSLSRTSRIPKTSTSSETGMKNFVPSATRSSKIWRIAASLRARSARNPRMWKSIPAPTHRVTSEMWRNSNRSYRATP